jgi:hypothetical protein
MLRNICDPLPDIHFNVNTLSVDNAIASGSCLLAATSGWLGGTFQIKSEAGLTSIFRSQTRYGYQSVPVCSS